jgi:hypothetical protein
MTDSPDPRKCERLAIQSESELKKCIFTLCITIWCYGIPFRALELIHVERPKQPSEHIDPVDPNPIASGRMTKDDESLGG